MTNRKEIIIKDGSIQLLSIEDCLKEYEKYIHSQCISYNKTLLGKGINGQSYDYDDLYQIASLSLMKAYDNYDYSTNNKFLTYYSLVLANDLNQLIRKTNRASKSNINLTSFEASVFTDSDGNEVGLIDLIPCKEICHADTIIQSETINDFLNSLPERKKKIFDMYYFENKTNIEIGKELNISQSYVSRILNKTAYKYGQELKHKDIMDESKVNNYEYKKEEIVMTKRKMVKRIDPTEMYNLSKESVTPESIATILAASGALQSKSEQEQALQAEKIDRLLDEEKVHISPEQVRKASDLSIEEVVIPVEKQSREIGQVITANPFAGLKIKNLVIEFADFEAEIIKGEVSIRMLDANPKSIEDLELMQKDLGRIKDIASFMAMN